jgi:putative Holliday junction resolvase
MRCEILDERLQKRQRKELFNQLIIFVNENGYLTSHIKRPLSKPSHLMSHISNLKSRMRIMAFDYGTKRIGIAVTDPMQIIATGLDTIHPNQIIEYLKKYIQTEQVERFIVGEPKQMDNTPSQSAIHVKGFVNLLKKTFPEIPIEMLDERFTSKMASAVIAQSGMNKKHRQNKELVDTISAVILLQSWMEGQNR